MNLRLLPFLAAAALAAVLGGGGCSRSSTLEVELPPPVPGEEARLVRCVAGDGPLVVRRLPELERRALDAEEAGDFVKMLACAEEALRREEESGWAAHLRAEALSRLGRLDAAREAFVMALALAPNDPYLLAGVGDFYVNGLPPSRERSLAGLHFARRGIELAEARPHTGDEELLARLHRIAAWGEADLGRFGRSLSHGRRALQLDVDDDAAWLVVGRALFELTRFEEAVSALEEVLQRDEGSAEAYFLLGLSLERLSGKEEEAGRAFRRAATLDRVRFPMALQVSEEALGKLVVEEVERLPREMRSLLRRAEVSILVEELPALGDLRSVEPPLSPTALGMFRGDPVADWEGGGAGDGEARAILLYGKNLRRASRTPAELREQVRITLLHELGHLLGEDEADLRARGLD